MDQSTTPAPTSTWGRSRFGGSSRTLILTSLSAGVLLAAGSGALFATLNKTDRPWLAFSIMTVGVLASFSAMVWAILVDRLTITGTAKRPEESVESRWYDQAASGTFTDMLLILGVSAAVFSIWSINLSSGLLLALLIVVMMADFGLRYFITSRRNR